MDIADVRRPKRVAHCEDAVNDKCRSNRSHLIKSWIAAFTAGIDMFRHESMAQLCMASHHVGTALRRP